MTPDTPADGDLGVLVVALVLCLVLLTVIAIYFDAVYNAVDMMWRRLAIALTRLLMGL